MVMSMETNRANGTSGAVNGVANTAGINGHRQHSGFSNGAANGNRRSGHTNGSHTSQDENLDLHRVLEQVQADDEGKWDTTVFRDQLIMLNGRLLVPDHMEADGVEELVPTSWATAQMCGRLGIPTAYFRRCPLDLQDAQFNVWARHRDRFETDGFEDYNRSCTRNGVGRNGSSRNGVNSSNRNGSRSGSSHERWLLRIKHDSVRGVLSDRYTRLDNQPFLDCLQPLLPTRLQVKWFALTGESLHLRLIDPTLAREVLPDDRIMVGLHIANSEVGKRAVTVDAIVWRLVCQNGLVRLVKGKSLMHQRHMFVSSSGFKRDLEHAMGEALTIAAGLLERMQQATTEHLEDIQTVIERIGERHNLSEAFQEQIKNALLLENRGQQETLYGLTNALTQAAQTLPPDERYGLEVLAGEVMERGALWLNDLPKAKAKRKTELAMAANGSSSSGSTFVSDATTQRRSIAEPSGRHEIAPTSIAQRTSSTRLNGNGLIATRPTAQPLAHSSAPTQPTNRAVESGEVETAPTIGKLLESGVQSPSPNSDTMTLKEEKTDRDDDAEEERPTSAQTPDTNDAVETHETRLASRTQKEVICTLVMRRSLGTYDLHYLMEQEFDKSDLNDLTPTEAKQLTAWLQQRPREELLAPIPAYEDDEDMADVDE